jgi:hypothetical protein
MNLFLLTAVPLAAVAAHRFFHPSRQAFADWKVWIQGFVWAMIALVAAAFFGGWRVFSGDLVTAFLGLTATDVLLVPGVVVAAWILTRPQADAWELGLWLAMAFTFAGLRDFAATDRMYDLGELFLVPLDRVLLILALPRLVLLALDATAATNRWLWTAAAAVLALTGSLFPVLSFAGWGWLVWLLEAAGLAAALFLGQKKAASSEAA